MVNVAQNPQIPIAVVLNIVPVTNPDKIRQLFLWKFSDFYKTSSSVHLTKRTSFDKTTEFLDNCINFQKDEIESMIASGIHIDCADKDNLTALHQACINCNLDLVLYLLSKNANIDATDREGWTPLHIAADMGSLELAKVLIDHNARLDSTNYDGDLPVSLVNTEDYPELDAYFHEEMSKRNINEEYCRDLERRVMHEDVLHWKISGVYNPPIDIVNKSTPLHVASSKNYLDVLSELIPMLNNDQLNAQDIDGWTALHAAAHWGNREACKMLIKAGADIDIATNANETLEDTVDAQLKDDILSDIKIFQMEKTRAPQIVEQISIRSGNVYKRRTSVARLSVEWKRQHQSKDPALELEIKSQAAITPDLDETDSHKDLFARSDNPESDLETNVGTLHQSLSQVMELDESKAYEMTYGNDDILTDTDSTDFFGMKDDNNKPDHIRGFSDGDNSSFPFISAAGVIVHDNFDFNNGAVSDALEKSSSESDKINQAEEGSVKLRPKSVRDIIKDHRSTTTSNSRLSIIMAPAKSESSEAKRREKARRSLSTRRCTQGINLTKSSIVEGNEILSADLNGAEKYEEEPIVTVDINYTPLMETPAHRSIKQMRIDSSCHLMQTPSPYSPASHVDSPRPDHKSSIPSKTLKTLSRPSVHTIPEELHAYNADSIGLNLESTSGYMADRSTGDQTETDSGRFVARPVLGIRRTETNDASTPKNVKISASEFSNALAKCSQQIHHSSSSNSTGITDDKSITTIANRLVSDETLKQELQAEILALKEELQELKYQNTDLYSALKRSKEEQTNRNGGDDRISTLETELAVSKDETLKLKSQNEALLRVIAKIQQQLTSVMKPDWHQ